jgi:hypothetical protein
MPVYLYECLVSSEEFETTHSIKTEQEDCIVCLEKGLPNHKPKALISGPSLGKVVLTGHALTAKQKEDDIKFSREVHASEKLYSNVLGESRYENLQQNIDRNKRR